MPSTGNIPVKFSVSSPHGDIHPSDEDLNRPLEGCPAGTAYRNYFRILADYCQKDGFGALMQAAEALGAGRYEPPSEIAIRAEKHGAFYHPARIDICFRQTPHPLSLCLAMATHPTGCAVMKKDYQLLSFLNGKYNTGLIPQVFDLFSAASHSLLLQNWFVDYHEFHVNSQGRIMLWDFKRGEREMSDTDAEHVFERIAYILGVYYDVSTSASINAWHLAAGDFIARTVSGNTDVRLTTVRDYSPLNPDDVDFEPLRALFGYFMELALRIRIDRVQGTEQNVFLGDYALRGALRGFLKAVGEKEHGDLIAAKLVSLLGSFTAEDYREICQSLCEEGFRGSDRLVALDNVLKHSAELVSLVGEWSKLNPGSTR